MWVSCISSEFLENKFLSIDFKLLLCQWKRDAVLKCSGGDFIPQGNL